MVDDPGDMETMAADPAGVKEATAANPGVSRTEEQEPELHQELQEPELEQAHPEPEPEAQQEHDQKAHQDHEDHEDQQDPQGQEAQLHWGEEGGLLKPRCLHLRWIPHFLQNTRDLRLW